MDPVSVLTEQCTFCITNGFPDCEKTRKQGACSACMTGKVKCSMKDRVNEYWKSTGKIRGTSQLRSMSHGPSERKTPYMNFHIISFYIYMLIVMR